MNRRLSMVMAVILMISALSVLAETVKKPDETGDTGKKGAPGKPVAKRGTGINAYKLGSSRRLFFDINRVWPGNRAHLAVGEDKCELYCPKNDLQIGDFTIPARSVYLVFYQDRLMRIRVINPYSGKGGRNLYFFTTMQAALTQKYGDVKSSEPIYTKYSGRYTWKKDDRRITLTYEMLEYGFIPLEKILKKVTSKKKNVDTSDI